MPISVIPYDPDWPRLFEQERIQLEQTLARWLSGGVHHIGSTSVPSLAAKPIIDMMAGVQDLTQAQGAIATLSEHGYVHAPHRPRAYWFYKPSTPHGHEHTHHLHLTEPGSDLWCERLAFRDALRANPVLRDEYQALKLQLAQAHNDITAYTADKRAFVGAVLARAGIALAPRPNEADSDVEAELMRGLP